METDRHTPCLFSRLSYHLRVEVKHSDCSSGFLSISPDGQACAAHVSLTFWLLSPILLCSSSLFPHLFVSLVFVLGLLSILWIFAFGLLLPFLLSLSFLCIFCSLVCSVDCHMHVYEARVSHPAGQQ